LKNDELKSDENQTVLPKKTCTISIKCNHVTHKITVTNCEKETMSLISNILSIPMSQLKLVGGGKVLHQENITESIFEKKIKKFMVS